MLESSNKFRYRTNRFKGNCTQYVEKDYSCLMMKKNFKSIHDASNKFTNYEKSQGTDNYKELRKIYREYKNGVDILDKYFEGDELLSDGIPDKLKLARLQNIIQLNTGENISSKDLVYNTWKYKHTSMTNIQFYLHKKSKDLNLILVDTHHLGIYAQKNGKYVHEREYQKHKDNKMDIKIIADELE